MKRWIQNIRFKNLQTEIQGYGYQYSYKRYLISILLGLGIVIAVGAINGLRKEGVLLLIVLLIVCIPILLIQQFQYLYEQQRFQELVRYMEQMMYAFQKHPKILASLEEVEGVTEGNMKEKIQQMRHRIEHFQEVSYREAFQILEQEYACSRLCSMHDFFLKIEELGGSYEALLSVLLEDVKLWTERVYLFQKERSQMKRKIVLSIVCVVGLCSVLFRMMDGQEFLTGISDQMTYQAGTTIIFILFILLFCFSQYALSGKWIVKQSSMTEEDIQKDWSHVKEDPMKWKRARVRLEKEVEKQFPEWLRGIVLSLQSDNVYRALTESIETAPYVILGPLEELVAELKEDPVSMKPYDNFLKELQVPEIHSAIKMLYAYTNTGSNEAKEQLQDLMKRNMLLSDRGERIENEDAVAKYSMIFYLPMFLGTGKMMLDMSVLFTMIFSLWSRMT